MDKDRFLVNKKNRNRGNLRRQGRDMERRFDASNYELERLLLKGKNKKVIELL